MIYTSFSYHLFKNIRLILALFSAWNTNGCSSILLSETFESCGIFLRNSQAYTNTQRDIIQEIIDPLQLEQTRPQSLIIKNELSTREIHPNIFRSMTYDCYLYVHVNFGRNLFSTIPSVENPLQSGLYKKALFLIIVEVNNYKMFKKDGGWTSQFERQYRIFVATINLTPLKNLHYTKPFTLCQKFFFCQFCSPSFVRLNPMDKTFLSFKLSSFEKKWVPEYAQHYYQLYYDVNLFANEEFCRKQNYTKLLIIISIYTEGHRKCSSYYMLHQLIVLASGSNFTLKLFSGKHYDYSKIPQVFDLHALMTQLIVSGIPSQL